VSKNQVAIQEKIYNIYAEQTVLISLMEYSELIEDIESELTENDFYVSEHRITFKGIITQFHKNGYVTKSDIRKYLQERNSYTDQVFYNLTLQEPIFSLEYHIKELKERTLIRELLQLSKSIEWKILDDDSTTENITNYIEKTIFQVTQGRGSKDFKDSPQIIMDTRKYLEKLKERGDKELIGVDTGFRELNKMTTGFNAGDLIIIAARPAMGKTSFALNIVHSVLKTGQGVAFFSLEMPSEQLAIRLLSVKTNIPLQSIRTGNMQPDEWKRLEDAMNDYEKMPLYVDDDGNANINLVRSKLRKLKTRNPDIGMAVIDYLQIMSSVNVKDRHMEVSDISRGLKLLARELNIPIIALSQLNRSLESRNDKRPILSDIRESGAIEQDADIILFVYRDDVYRYKEEKEKEKEAKKTGQKYTSDYQEKEEEEAEIIIGKQRNGPTGHVKLIFQKKYTRFVSPDPNGVAPKFIQRDVPNFINPNFIQNQNQNNNSNPNNQQNQQQQQPRSNGGGDDNTEMPFI